MKLFDACVAVGLAASAVVACSASPGENNADAGSSAGGVCDDAYEQCIYWGVLDCVNCPMACLDEGTGCWMYACVNGAAVTTHIISPECEDAGTADATVEAADTADAGIDAADDGDDGSDGANDALDDVAADAAND